MKKSAIPLAFSMIAVLPQIVLAVEITHSVSSFMGKVYENIVNPAITVLFAIAILYLSWSVFQYTFQGDKVDKDKLKASLIYGVLGVFIMSTVFAIVKFIATSVGGDANSVMNSI